MARWVSTSLFMTEQGDSGDSKAPPPTPNSTHTGRSLSNKSAGGRRSKNKKVVSKKIKHEGQPKKSAKAKTDTNFRYLEIIKLIKKHQPVTINGKSVRKLLDPHEEQENALAGKKSKQASKKLRISLAAAYIEKILTNNPTEAIYLSFIIKPSDPDFPFHLDQLSFSLTVPAEYPQNPKALPSIVVLNSDIPRGFSLNIERGYRSIALLAKSVKSSAAGDEDFKLVDGKGLLSQIQTLDKYLEKFLSQEKQQTMRFVTFKSQSKSSPLRTPSPTPGPLLQPQSQVKESTSSDPADQKKNISEKTLLRREFYLSEMSQKLAENVKLFNKSKEESRYKVSVPISSTTNLPSLWTRDNMKVDLFMTVPISYPTTPARVIIASNFSSNLMVAKRKTFESEGVNLIAVAEEASNAEKRFNMNVQQCIREKQESLVKLLNRIANQLSILVEPTQSYSEWVENMKQLREGLAQ